LGSLKEHSGGLLASGHRKKEKKMDRVIHGLFYSSKHCYRHLPRFGPIFTVQFYSLDFQKRLCREIALPAVWAANQGDIFDHQEISPFSVASAYAMRTRPFFPADIANHVSYPHALNIRSK
jgi:hypothetical protein